VFFIVLIVYLADGDNAVVSNRLHLLAYAPFTKIRVFGDVLTNIVTDVQDDVRVWEVC
jgi:hypothetical protein